MPVTSGPVLAAAEQPAREAAPVSRGKDREINRPYAAFHAPRFAFLVDVLADRVRDRRARVLDIGRSPLTELLSRRLDRPVDSLGLEPDQDSPNGRHFTFDLNLAEDPRQWRSDLGPYDVMVFAEVIEHLYTAPELVLSFLRSLLVPGGLLVLQTPNAASLRKRIKLLFGRNPYERIRADRSNPGHFREYTVSELRSIVSGAGFAVQEVWTRFYFDARYARHETGDEPPSPWIGGAKNVLNRLIPGSLSEGITLLATTRT
jgi:trans-aconitate methyltransferase